MKLSLLAIGILGLALIAADTPKKEKSEKEIKELLAKKTKITVSESGPLVDGLGWIKAESGIPIVIDKDAFAARGDPEIENQPIRFTKAESVAWSTVLKGVLDPIDATYRIQKGRILVIPK
jgi:hypothetical protein